MAKSTAELRRELSALTLARMGFDGSLVEQGSDKWGILRLGVITASRAIDLIAKGRSAGSVGEAQTTYLMELMGEIQTGAAHSFTSKETAWGHEHETDCVELVAFEHGVTVERIPFVYGNRDMRFGCSPDGLIDDNGGIEAKCPYNIINYNRFVHLGELKKGHYEQVQFCLYVTGRDFWIYGNHDPGVRYYPTHSIVIERDAAMMSTFDDALPSFIYRMDNYLTNIGYRFGDQWPTPQQEAAA